MSREHIPGRDAITWIYDQWLASNPEKDAVAVEVGVALGKSISYLAERCIALGRDDIIIYAVDSWCGDARNGEQTALADAAGGDWALYCKMMLDNCPDLFDRIRTIRESSSVASYMFDGCVDLVVLDADHTFESVTHDLACWLSTLKSGGWIGGDDHCDDYPGVIRACKEMFPDGYEVWFENQWNWPVWLKRGV